LAQGGCDKLNRGDKRVKKLLKNIEEKPENAAEILEIAKENPWDFRWICKEVFHHENFNTPEKCKIIENIIYELILLGIKEHLGAVFDAAAGCMMPFEAKETRSVNYKKVNTEEKIRMHTDRTFSMMKVFERLEKHDMYLFGAPESAHVDVVGEIHLSRLREKIAKYHKLAGLELPIAFRKKEVPKRETVRRPLRQVA